MPPAIDTFGSLLDRSVDDIARHCADARAFDRQAIYRLSDIWDNNTFPLLYAATAPTAWGRSRLARRGLRWMGEFGTSRYDWVVEAAPSLVDMLSRPAELRYSRDHMGRLYCWSVPLTEAGVVSLDVDYDLAGATVRSLDVERAGSVLTARCSIEANRRYATGAADSERAVLHFVLNDVDRVHFDAADRSGSSVTVTAKGVALGLGRHGMVRGARGEIRPDDMYWHLSQAGQAADKVVAPERPARDRGVTVRWLRAAPTQAARVLHEAMLHVRAVRHGHLAPRIPAAEIAEVLAGAGSAVVAAGRSRSRASDDTFRQLARRWQERLRPLDIRPPAPLPEGAAHLRRVVFTAEHLQWSTTRPASVSVHLAVPGSQDTAPWRLAGEQLTEPTRFQLNLPTTDEPADLRRNPETLTLGTTLTIHATPDPDAG
ncbi:hypothetical protein [Catellatospora coxensis]|uniref:Uncharacterized protein n=1 Tax=Catellatospora coxensis TaxID=310354 RepID=A0A8J3PBI8_9ACTN|nr:hypothetical protein [Catellatospora coxensis]GIG10443.1 hypothetical protein Cco03nite_71430 [Catellatospora coxensis]